MDDTVVQYTPGLQRHKNFVKAGVLIQNGICQFVREVSIIDADAYPILIERKKKYVKY